MAAGRAFLRTARVFSLSLEGFTVKKHMIALAAAALLSTITAAPAFAISHGHSKTLAASSCTQVDEAQGLCTIGKSSKKVVKSAKPKVHYVTKSGKRLPRCEDVGGSQADNGSSCWY